MARGLSFSRTRSGRLRSIDATVFGPNLSQPSATLYEPLVMNVRMAVASFTHVRFHPSASRR